MYNRNVFVRNKYKECDSQQLFSLFLLRFMFIFLFISTILVYLARKCTQFIHIWVDKDGNNSWRNEEESKC